MRKKWVQGIIDCLNSHLLDFQYRQDFRFKADETEMVEGKIDGKLDSYLIDEDIGGILGRFVYDDVESVINDMNSVRNIFGSQQNRENCNEILSRFWHHWN